MKRFRFSIIKKIVLGLILLTLFGFGFMYLWNWLIPELFRGPELNFYQAIGLLVLSKMLFFGFAPFRRHGPPHHYWKKRFAQRVAQMDPEDRERLKEKLREKWGKWGCHFPEEESPREEGSV